MKLLQAIVLILAFTSISSEPIQLYSASTFIDYTPGPLTGSILGGTTIYIKGVGFPTDVNMISIYVGEYPCKIPADGLTPTTIACETSSSLTMTQKYDLPIYVMAQQEILIVPEYVFSYVYSATPSLSDIYPLASSGDTFLNYYGIHRVLNPGNGIRDMGDFIGLYVGNELCGLFDIAQPPISYNGYSRVQCLQARQQQGGKYNISEHVVAGWASKQWQIQRTSFVKQYYQFTVLPAITSVSPNRGNYAGQDIVIKGTGFSKNMAKVSVNIDGTNCVVTSSTNTQINCKVAPKSQTNSAALSSNSGQTLVDNYISGTGFSYQRFNISGLVNKTIPALKVAYKSNSNQIKLLQKRYVAQLRTTDVYGVQAYAQVFKGYFYAPVSGAYIFRGAADDQFSLLIGSQYGTSNTILNQQIYSTSVSASADNYYISNFSISLGKQKVLQGGKYYYMEIYHINNGGPGYLKISVQVPNINQQLIKKRYQVNQIETKFTNDPQIMQYVLEGVTGGKFNLSYYKVDSKTLQVLYNQQVQINYNAGISEFQNALNQLYPYSGFWISCTSAQAFDVNGASVTLQSNTGVKFVWTVSIFKLRPTPLLAQKLTFKPLNLVAQPGVTPKFTQTRIQNHAPLLSGSFTMQMGGLPIKVYDPATSGYTNPDIPANITAYALEHALRQIVGFQKVSVHRKNDPDYGALWIISYFEYTGNVPDIVLSGSKLIGGKPGTLPTVQFFQTRTYSSNLLFNPVDENFLFMADNGPNVIVTVNNLKSVCINECNYQFLSNTPQILTQSLSGSTVTVTVSNPSNWVADTSILMAKLGDQWCQIPQGPSFTSFTCQLPINPDQSPLLQAGYHNIQLMLFEQGYIPLAVGVPPINYDLVLTSVGPNQGGVNGGYQLTLTGKGFPASIQEARITLCGVQAQIISISNTQTKIIAPECASTGPYDITYFFSTRNASISYTYTTSTLTSTLFSISPISASPVLKAVMTISGQGFGTDISKVRVSLANSTGKVYQMRVLSVNDTEIKCGIPGGLPGKFDVKVSIDGLGDINPSSSTADDFTYQLVIESVSPTTVAHHGGTLITITGRNFSPDLRQNLVHIGNQLNWLCYIQSLTRSQIKCRVPGTHPDWKNNSQGIVITNRLIQDSECANNNCIITYSDKLTSPNITSISTSDTVSGLGSGTIWGNNFGVISASDVRVVFHNTLTDQQTIVTPTSVTGTSIAFDIPSLEAGNYNVRARLDPVGQTNSIGLKLRSKLYSTSLSGSIKGGKIILSGEGLPSKWPRKLFNVKLNTNSFYESVQVISTTPKRIELRVGQGLDNQTYNITLTNPLQQILKLKFTQLISSTPTISILTPTSLTTGTKQISLNRTKFPSTNPTSISIYSVLSPEQQTPVTTWSYSGSQILFNFTFKAGRYGVRVYYSAYGQADVTGNIDVRASAPYTATVTNCSYFGGILTVTGDNISPESIIKVGGFVGKIDTLTRTPTHVTFRVPPLITPVTIAQYPQLGQTKKITPESYIADTNTVSKYSFDGQHSTYYSSNNTNCYVGIDVGNKKLVSIKRIRYLPYHAWTIASNYLKGAVFEASVDGNNYVKIGEVDQTVHAGWNSFILNLNTNYRYVRLSHNSTSQCKIGQFQVYGVLLNDISVNNMASFSVDASFSDGFNQYTFASIINYRTSYTPVINSLNQTTGSIYGNQVILLNGLNLNIGVAQIQIDGKVCTVNGAATTATTLQCTTQQRLELPHQNTFTVSIGGNVALTKQKFLYVMRWSDIRTWGTDLPPVQGDLVYVPKGMSLFVDQSTPRLDGIVVEDGKLIFADEGPMEIHTNLITVNRGQFIAGTEKKPYIHKLTFIMYGHYYGKQLPMFGNKGIGCMECKLSMYGTPRTKTWTTIANTVGINATTFTVSEPVDWKVGQQIVIASTDFDHNQAEQRVITQVSGNTFTVDKPFNYKHYSGVQTYGNNGNDKLQMRAQVGLLTRNIKMMGDPTSEQGQYGSHLMMAGSSENGLVGQVAYTQFTHCGQPRIMGRYCIHFHMNGDAVNSFAKGNAVHHSFARVITLHGVQYLHVSQNVGYRVKGHNFFIQDGIQTQNVIQNNLAIGSLQSWNMMQTDISVASFWVTNPLNHLRNNRAAGGDFYGFWYEIKPHPDGPSATMDICPMGNPLGQSHDNIAHSYKRFGLRIFKLYPRQHPCMPTLNFVFQDPWSQNPSIPSKFYNYVLYKNGQDGLLAQQTGNMIFENFTIAESKRAGMEFYKANFTKQYVTANNSIIIGLTQNNRPSVLKDEVLLSTSAGVIGPRTYGWGMQNIRFYNFGPNTTIMQTCSFCDDPLLVTNTANQYVVSKIFYTNVTGKYLKMNGLKRQIVYDLDGTFSAPFNSLSRTSATVVGNFKHIAQQSGCSTADDTTLWDDSLVCDQTIKIRKVKFINLREKSLFASVPMKIQKLSDVNEVVPENSTDCSQVYSTFDGMQPMVDHKFAYHVAFVADRIYSIWWLTGVDFSHLHIQISRFFQDIDPAIIFKFNYTQNRQLFQIGQWVNGQIVGNYTAQTINQNLDQNTCQYGDYTHDVDNRTLTVCATSRSRVRQFQLLQINGIKCRYICPIQPQQCTMQKFLRVWSNASQWPNQQIPTDMQNVTIPCQWTVVMDVQPAIIDYWLIKGRVIIPDTNPNVHIKAHNIWITSGTLQAGLSPTSPYTGSLTIQLLGNKSDRGIVIDPMVAGNKMFVVTGNLLLYGQVPATTWTKLTAIVRPGDTQIKVISADGWHIGDQLAISPSFRSASQHQKVTITAINGNTISITPPIKYLHYGDPSVTISNAIGELDTRTGVGHLTRKIKIISGQDSGWGYHLLVYGFIDDRDNVTVLRTGSAVLHGVQFYEGGQYDTQNSALKLHNTIGTNPVTIYKSSFHQCKSLCLDINNINNANIKQNVFYNGRLFLVRANQLDNYYFQKNLMISATGRPTMPANTKQMIACYATYTPLHEITASIKNNLCQGSKWYGFVLPYVPCQMVDNAPYSDNTAGSARYGYTYNKINTQCLGASGAKSYGCYMGHMGHSPSTKTKIWRKFMIADSDRGVTLRFGIPRNDDDNTGYFRDSFITAISRPNCTQCYGQTTNPCRANRGVRMLTVTINGESLPSVVGDDFDIICRQECFDAKVFVNNVIFQNFRINYPTLPQCFNNSVFQPHKAASDLTGSHHLQNTVCNNCQFSALARFSPPNPKDLGWFGGCGRIQCTGRSNYIITDYTGHYLGFVGFLLANNSEIGDNTDNCTFDSKMNGHFCRRLDFGVIQYESIAPDFNTRIMWPVYLKFDGGRWNSTTNGWRQWEWDGNQPLNKRLGRFISVVQVNQVYNMTFESQPPIDMRFQFQRRTVNGNNSEYIVIKIHHPVPNSIRVQNRGVVIKPISLLDNNGQAPLDTAVCGSNKFFYQNYTIHFVLTADKNCQVRVSLTNSIQLTARFSMDIDQFYAADGPTKFIDRMCAVLGIVDTSRLKIVGIYNGSVIIHAYIDEARNTTVENASSNNNDLQKQEIKQLNQKLVQLYKNGEIRTQMLGAGLGQLIQLNSQTYYHKYDPQYFETQDNMMKSTTALAIGLVSAVVSVIAVVVIGVLYIRRKQAKTENLHAIQMTQSKVQDTIVEDKSNLNDL